MKGILLSVLLIVVGISLSMPPAWYLHHVFASQGRVFVPSMRGYPPIVELEAGSGLSNIYYHDSFFNEWIPVGTGGYRDLRMYGTGAIMMFAGILSIGSFSDGIWRWTSGTPAEVEVWTYRPSFFDVYPTASCWIVGGYYEMLVKFYDTGLWSSNIDTVYRYGPFKGVIATPETIHVLCSINLANSFDGGHTWVFTLEPILATDTYSPTDMVFDFETGISYITTWGGVVMADRAGNLIGIDAGCGHGGMDIELARFSGEKWLMLLRSGGQLVARNIDVPIPSWQDWTSTLPAGDIVVFGAKLPSGAAMLMLSGKIYFSDTLSTAVEEISFHENRTISAFPNPFNSSCRIRMPNFVGDGNAVEIFDPMGRTVERIDMKDVSGNSHEIVWQPKNSIENGIYIISATIDGKRTSTPVVLFR